MKFVTQTLAVIAMTSTLALPTMSSAGEFDDLVAKVEAYYAGQTDFSARFEQTVQRAGFPDRPLKKMGKVYFQKPGKMRWDYTEPDRVFYISDGEFLWNYVPDAKIAYKIKVKDSELFYALRFLYGEGSLTRDFHVADGGTVEGRRVVVLKPKTGAQNFQELRLNVDVASGQIHSTVMVDPAGNVSTITFVKVSNQALPASGFVFKAPDDVQIEDLSSPSGGQR